MTEKRSHHGVVDRFVTTGKSQRVIRDHKQNKDRVVQQLLTDWKIPKGVNYGHERQRPRP